LTKNYTTILSGDSSGNLFYWDFNFQKKKSFKFHSEAITDISLSFNDLKFITSSDDKKSKIIDVETGEEENEFEHGSNLKSCHWNPYKSIVATAGKDNLIKIWDPKSGDCINTLYKCTRYIDILIKALSTKLGSIKMETGFYHALISLRILILG
jgi:polyadenylation factor subunit 2